MASLAKILGLVCVLLAVALVALGFYVALSDKSAPGLSDEAVAFGAFVYLVGSASVALVLATIGSAAHVIGRIGQDHQDWVRNETRRRPAPPPPPFASPRPGPPPPS